MQLNPFANSISVPRDAEHRMVERSVGEKPGDDAAGSTARSLVQKGGE